MKLFYITIFIQYPIQTITLIYTKIQQVLLILVTYVMTDNVQNTYVTLYHISSLS